MYNKVFKVSFKFLFSFISKLSTALKTEILKKYTCFNDSIGRVTIDVLMFMKHLDGALERKGLTASLTKITFLWI